MKKHLFSFGILCAALLFTACAKDSAPTKISLDDNIEQAMKQWQIPGLAVVAVKDGETVLMRGYGTREAGKDSTIDDKTYLQIASNSKAFTAYLFGMLVDDGKLKWSDPVINYIPELVLPDPYVTKNIAIDDLLCHRSGLTGAVPGGFQNRDFTFEALLEYLASKELSTRFRSENNYSQVGMAILGEVIWRVTDRTWGENMRQRIFESLGMKNSYTSNLDFEQRVGVPDSIENIMQPATKKEGVVTPVTWKSVGSEELYAPAGGIISTMSDMAKWIAFRINDGLHVGNRLISQDAVAEIRKVRIPADFARLGIPNSAIYPKDPLMGTGFGHYTFEHFGNKVLVHNGGWMFSVVEVIPEKNFGVGVFSNAMFSDLHGFEGGAFVNAIALTVIDHYLGHDYVDWPGKMLEVLKEGN
jgi:CubicO group peptidase (beta-lactamase class C family)